MAYTKKELIQSIKGMQDIIDDKEVPDNIKDSIRPSLAEAKKLLAGLEEKKPAAKATGKKAAAMPDLKPVPLTKKEKNSLKAIVQKSKELTDMYGGYSEAALQRDSKRGAKKPGSRTSDSGKTYREYRPNRSDVKTGVPHLAKGGSTGKSGTFSIKKIKIEIDGKSKSLTIHNATGLQAARLTIIRELQRNYIGYKGSEESKRFVKHELEKRIEFVGDNTEENKEAAINSLTIDILSKSLGKQGLYAAGGPIGKGANGYIAFYKGKQVEVMADSSYQAQQKAAAHFKAKKSYDVTVMLAEKEGEQVTHVPDFAEGGHISQIWLSVDGNDPISYEEFYAVNTAEDVEALTEAEFEEIRNLKVGETFQNGIHSASVKRVSGPDAFNEIDIEEQTKLIDNLENDDPIWHNIGLNRPPANFTPAAVTAFKKAIEELEAEKDKESGYYKNAKTALTALVYLVNKMLDDDMATAEMTHENLQEVGVLNYKTGMLVNTDFLNKELATRRLAQGGLTSGYHKDWEVTYITLPGKQKKITLTLGRKSDRLDVQMALKRRTDLNIREVVSMKEGQIYAAGGRIKSANNRDRAYKSREPWEHAYTRKTRPKNPGYQYAKGGSIKKKFKKGDSVDVKIGKFEISGKIIDATHKGKNIKERGETFYVKPNHYLVQGPNDYKQWLPGKWLTHSSNKAEKGQWIHSAITHPRALRRTAKREGLIKGKEKLSMTDLKKLEKQGGKTKKRAVLAETLKGFKQPPAKKKAKKPGTLPL